MVSKIANSGALVWHKRPKRHFPIRIGISWKSVLTFARSLLCRIKDCGFYTTICDSCITLIAINKRQYCETPTYL